MAKRFTLPNVNWSFIIQNLSSEEVSKIAPVKAAYDKFLREVATKPADLPKIDWALYKSKISVPGMVDTFQKTYEGLNVPYPSDKGLLAENEKINASMIAFAEKATKEMAKYIEELKIELKKLESVMKLSEMTIEELFLARPDLRLDPDNPKFFPQYFPDPPEAKKREPH